MDWLSVVIGAVSGAAWMFLLLWYTIIKPMAKVLGWDRKSYKSRKQRPGFIYDPRKKW